MDDRLSSGSDGLSSRLVATPLRSCCCSNPTYSTEIRVVVDRCDAVELGHHDSRPPDTSRHSRAG